MSPRADAPTSRPEKGRFAPSPSGRMHLGNIYAALLSWLSAKSRGGSWLLRIEDLDPQRSRREYAQLIEDDLRWLGLLWDEGGLDGLGSAGPYVQSLRGDIYRDHLERLDALGLTYNCSCTRADIMATQAPHRSDGRVVYAGTCRPAQQPPFPVRADIPGTRAAVRLPVPSCEVSFVDRICGRQRVNLAAECGDFIMRRSDGAWAYQLAVVVDDALMGVTEVVRGDDLLLSTAQQIYLYELFGYAIPEFAHLPLLCNEAGQRLSKRDASLSMEQLRRDFTPERLIGHIAHLAGIISEPMALSTGDLLELTAASPQGAWESRLQR
ncbi:MAG: tRNA glutamyl-Q(34) synthetase GluQRS [Candidatus Amulumruptor caecigallinarius]|nr:tRNA glutamyl-Q(34) synthetase GluQRS [Candidatus Amulumruptor caecigallinarius]MCM1397202.1 tRNA glutamyl-Q(34) synthetase GluQRS [Candidatus Amulumruptor caecigallinarius]MCM1453109.1 tRNA glutamyl-Q(34) synthetase GluQRS [bacterium]